MAVGVSKRGMPPSECLVGRHQVSHSLKLMSSRWELVTVAKEMWGALGGGLRKHVHVNEKQAQSFQEPRFLEALAR